MESLSFVDHVKKIIGEHIAETLASIKAEVTKLVAEAVKVYETAQTELSNFVDAIDGDLSALEARVEAAGGDQKKS
jgi:hypothetical protein